MLEIQSTQDYTLFKRIKGNRHPESNSGHIARLRAAIEADPQAITYNPLIVNEKMQVIDGQHRLVVLQELGLPVYYIKVPGLRLGNVQLLNALSKPWSPMDYARSYAELGNENYAIYIDFKEVYKLNHDVLINYLGLDNAVTSESFKRGKLVVFNKPLSDELCQQLLDIFPYYDRAKTRSFALGFLDIARSPKYDHNRFLKQLQANDIQEQALPNDYAREIERVYNFRKPHADNVRFF